MSKCAPKTLKVYKDFEKIAGNNSQLAEFVWIALDGKIDHLKNEDDVLKAFLENDIDTTLVSSLSEGTDAPLSKFTRDDVKELVDNLLFLTVWDVDNQKLIDDITSITTEDLKTSIEKQKKQLEEKGIFDYSNNYEEILKQENLEALKIKMDRKLIRLGISIDPDEDPDTKNEGINITDSYLISTLDKARVSTKLMVAFLPKKGTSTVLGLRKFADFSSTWNDLSEILSSTADTIGESDKYVVFKNILLDQVKYREEYNELVNLLEKSSENQRTQFVRSLDNFKIEWLKEYIKSTDKDTIGYEVRNIDPNKYTNSTKLLSKWDSNYIDRLLSFDNEGKPLLKKVTAEKILAQYDKLSLEVSKAKEITPKLIDDTLTLMSVVGINMNTESLKVYLDTRPGETSLEALNSLYSNNVMGYLFKNSDNSIEYLISNPPKLDSEDKVIKSPFLNETKLEQLSDLEARFQNTLISNSVLGPDNKMYQSLAQHDFMSKTILNIKEGNEYLSSIESDFTKNSRFIKHLKNADNKEKLKLQFFLSRQMQGEDSGLAMNDLSEVDEFASRIEKVLSGKLPYFTLADKNRVYYLDGLPTITNMVINGDNVLQFVGYLADEMNTMRKAWEEVYGENKIPEDKQTLNYHYKIDKEGNRVPGNAFTLSTFPSLNPGTELANELGLYNSSENNKPFTISGEYIVEDADGNITPDLGFGETVQKVVFDTLNDKIEATTNKMMDQLITVNSKGVSHTSFSTETYEKYIKSAPSIREGVRRIATNFTLNTMAANIEFAKMFTGDSRMYKNQDDFLKRIPATSATGDYLRIVKGKVNETFDIAVAPNVNFESTLVDKKSLKKIAKFIGATSKRELDELKAIIKPYRNVNRTDAQAWITMDRFKEIQIGMGQWTDELEEAFNNIVDPKKKSSYKDYKAFSQTMTSMQPKKGMHFEIVDDGYGNKAPVYLKYSQAVLFPELVSSSPQLTRFSEQMKAQGVSELIVGDGVKVGAIEATDLGTQLTDLIKFNTITLSNKNWKLQQDLPSKTNLEKDSLVGSQIKKNIIADIDEIAMYGKMTGKQLIEAIHEMDSELSNRGLEKLHRRFNVKDGKLDINIVYDELIKEFEKSGESDNIIGALKQRVPIDNMISHRKKIWSKIASIWNSATVKIKQPGGAAIQMSDYGFETGENIVAYESIKNSAKNGIVWLTNDRKLKPPRVEADDTFSAGQCLLPYSKLASLFGREWDSIKKLPTNEIIKRIDPAALKMIGYRIPNQKLASNDSLEIVGILPPHAGDSIVLYSEITAKTGSDFDIDKMYYILPQITKTKKTDEDGSTYNYIDTVKYLDDSNSTIEDRYEEYIKDIKTRRENRNNVKDLIKEAKLDKFDKNALSTLIDSSKNLKDKIIEIIGSTDTDEIVNEILVEEEVIPSIEEFSKSSVKNQNTEKALQTRRVDLYRAVLESPHSYKRLITSVDSEVLKNQIDVLFPRQELSDLEIYDGTFQMNIRREFITSKGGVGQVANHQGDNAISQGHKLFLRDSSKRLDLGNMTENGDLDLSNHTVKEFEVLKINKDKDGNITSYSIEDTVTNKYYISEVISAYMNAFVDAAKDNYIGRANFNFLTNNTAFLLIRNGVSPQYVNAFIGQPAIKEYIRRTALNEGQAVEKNTEKPLPALYKELGIYKSTSLGSLESANLSSFKTKGLMDNIVKNRDIKLSDLSAEQKLEQAKLLNLFIHAQNMSKILGDINQASKADTNGNSGSLSYAYIISNLITNVGDVADENGTIVGNWEERFDNTMLGAYYNNSISDFINKFGPHSLMGTPVMQHVVNTIYYKIYGEQPSDSKKYDKIFELTYAAKLSTIGAFDREEGTIEDLFKGPTSIAKQVRALKNNPVYNSNVLIDMLDTKFSIYNNPEYVFIDNTKGKDATTTNKITEDWLSLYLSDKETDKKLATDLAVYSFYTSALSDNISSLQRYVPYQIINEIGLGEKAFNTLRTELNDVSNAENILQELTPQVMKNAWKFNNVVPKVSNKGVLKVGEFESKESKKNVFSVNEISSPSLKVGNDKDKNPIFKPYVTRTLYYENPRGKQFPMVKVEALYKYEGNTEQGEGKAGVYARIPMLGSKSGRFDIFEFTLNDNKESIIKSNNYKMGVEISKKFKDINIDPPGALYIKNRSIVPVNFETTEKSGTFEEDKKTISNEVDDILSELDNGCKNKDKK